MNKIPSLTSKKTFMTDCKQSINKGIAFMILHTALTITAIILAGGCTAGNTMLQKNNERKQLFDYNWKFKLGDFPSAIAEDFDDESWRNLDLPHDWSIEGKLDQKTIQKLAKKFRGRIKL